MTTQAIAVQWRNLVRTSVLVMAFVLGTGLAFGQTTHVVARGNTLQKIAKRYHTTVEALREANNLSAGERLKLGQRLIVPDPKQNSETTTGSAPEAGRRVSREEAKSDDQALSREDSRNSTRDGSRSSRPQSYVSRPPRPGIVHLMRDQEQWKGRVLDRRKRVVPDATEHFVYILRDYESKPHAIHPRLIELMAKVSDHFGGRPLMIVSGFRHYSPAQYTAHSNHNQGHAVDFRVQGVPNPILRDFCHTLQNVGVGYYPNSSFIHLDVRSVGTRWTDASGPGEAPRYTSVTASPPKPSGEALTP